MNDMQVGLWLVACSVLAMSIKICWGFIDKGSISVAVGVIPAVLWYLGTLAMYPFFAPHYGGNPYLGYTIVMAIISALAIAILAFLELVLFFGFFYLKERWENMRWDADREKWGGGR